MKKPLLFLLSFCYCLTSFGQTYFYNMQEVSGTWTKKGSPYIIQGEVIVPKGKTLTIKPEVVVKFNTGENRDYGEEFNLGFLRINGKLIAKGKAGAEILFTRSGNTGNWGNLFFNSGDAENVLQYCKIENSFYMRSVVSDDLGTDNGTGALSFYRSRGTVKNCLIVNNGWTGINCKQGSAPLIMNCVVFNNKYGIECNSASMPKIINTILQENETCFFINGESQPQFSYSLLQENELDPSYDRGYNIFGKDPMFIDKVNNDFRLNNLSPAKKAGKDKKNIGAY